MIVEEKNQHIPLISMVHELRMADMMALSFLCHVLYEGLGIINGGSSSLAFFTSRGTEWVTTRLRVVPSTKPSSSLLRRRERTWEQQNMYVSRDSLTVMRCPNLYSLAEEITLAEIGDADVMAEDMVAYVSAEDEDITTYSDTM
jgi:hypothetical protein